MERNKQRRSTQTCSTQHVGPPSSDLPGSGEQTKADNPVSQRRHERHTVPRVQKSVEGMYARESIAGESTAIRTMDGAYHNVGLGNDIHGDTVSIDDRHSGDAFLGEQVEHHNEACIKEHRDHMLEGANVEFSDGYVEEFVR
jgi:hypothetical protein